MRIIQATKKHIELLAPNLRQEDMAEIWASSKSTPLEALTRAFNLPGECWALMNGDEVICMFGVARLYILDSKGSPWMLASDEISKHYLYFLRESKKYVKIIKSRYENLENYVDARNKISIKWLRWLGFEIGEARPYGVLKMPFHKFNLSQDIRSGSCVNQPQ